ncbi:MAG TPA: hypothetical protein VG244_06515 [Acidimicrobiales bacterium]|nr:hypothetical protein [Acidimicrobiales bacterium]
MARIDDLLATALKTLDPKPPDTATREAKRLYSEAMSARIAVAFADELRDRGMKEARPSGPGDVGTSGAERRLAGGIGAKRVDVTWATEESGLLLGISVKTINFRDGRSKNFQKNLTNRRGDMLGEALTLHRRFPYAVVAGFLFLDKDAKSDQTGQRKSTFENAFPRLKIFTGRQDPAARDEQFERLYLLLVDANPFTPSWECYQVSDPKTDLPLESVIDDLITLVAERNFDFYEADNGMIRRA